MRVDVDGATLHIKDRIGSGNPVRERMSTGLERLKPGPGQSPEQVRMNQRARIHRAMVELAAASGYERVTVRGLTKTAGISTRTFYLHFANREECLASAIATIGHQFLARAAYRPVAGDDWQGQVRASLESLFEDLGREPRAAHLLLVEALSAGRPGRTSAIKLTADFERLLAQLLAPAPLAPAPPRRLVVGIAAGVIRVATMTTLTGRARELPALAAELGDWVLTVYDEGTVALCRPPAARPNRTSRREPQPFPADPSALGGLGEDERILAAAAKLAAGLGPTSLTASKIRREAGVSRRSFDSRFRDATDCFLAAVEAVAQTAASRADAWAGAGKTQQLNGRTLLALAAMIARNQPQARMVLEGVLVPGRDGLLLRERLISDAAYGLSSSGRLGPRDRILAAEASVAATWRIAQREVLAGRGQRLPRCAALLSALLGRASASQ